MRRRLAFGGMESGPAWSRRESIETTLSAFGAGFIGLGVGLVLGLRAPAVGWAVLGLGLAAHALGMAFLHKRRKGHGDEQPAWLEHAYWLCWAILVAVIGLVMWLALR